MTRVPWLGRDSGPAPFVVLQQESTRSALGEKKINTLVSRTVTVWPGASEPVPRPDGQVERVRVAGSGKEEMGPPCAVSVNDPV